jgi:hypothetical protein
MSDQMNITLFLKKLRQGRANWDALLARIPEEQLTIPGASGVWTVKDVVAHVTWHEREMIGMLDGRTMEHGSDLWMLPTDERNNAIYELHKDRPLEEILAEAPQVYEAMLALINTLSDEELHAPSRFEFMPNDWVPWEIIASNTYGHYEQHTPGIEAWIKKHTEREQSA